MTVRARQSGSSDAELSTSGGHFRRKGLNDGTAPGHLMRAICGAPHPERNFAPSLNANAPLAQLLELGVRNDYLHGAIVIGIDLLQTFLHKRVDSASAALRVSVC
jgi:hypothetical protein